MKSFIKHIFILLISLVCFLQTNAQNFNASFDTDTILIGDIFSLKLDVLGLQEEERLYFPNFVDTIGKFEIIETYPEDTLENGISKKWDISVYEPGTYQINGFSALVQRKNGKADTIKNFEPLFVYVKSIALDTTGIFKPIKPSKNIPYPWKEVLKKWAIPFAVALAILLGIFFYFYFRKKSKEDKTVIKTPLDFHVEALSKLKAIEQQKLWQNNQIKEYYLEISETLRTYLEGRYDVNAMESTTDEIIEDLAETDVQKALNTKLKEVLQQCDLAKFAKFKPNPEENTRLMRSAQNFVLHTKPKPVIEEPKNKA
ncbi:MAG: hypothetical protein ACPG4Y_04935 [Chitinophagales bacterium]